MPVGLQDSRGVGLRRPARSGVSAPFYVPVLDRAVARWKASEYSGSGNLLDLSGNGHHLTPTNVTWLDYTGTKYVYLPGVAGNYLSTPDSAALSITGDVTVDAHVALDDWTPAATNTLASNLTAGATGDGYELAVLSTGVLRFTYNPGTGDATRDSTVAVGAADGSVKWVRVSFDADNGAVGNDTRFYTSDDGSTWAQLGATVTTAGVATIGNASPVFGIGARAAGATNPAAGKFYRVRVAASDARATTPTFVFDADPSVAVEPYATFVESSSNAATVTFGRSSSGKKTTVVDRDMFLLGTNAYFEAADHANLDFAAGESFTVAVAFRHHHHSGTTTNTLLAKKSGTGISAGYAMLKSSTANRISTQFSDGTAQPAPGTTVTGKNGLALVAVLVRDVAADNGTVYFDGTADAATADTTTGSLANAEVLRMGRLSGAGTTYGDFELVGAAVWREALSASDIAALDAEFGV